MPTPHDKLATSLGALQSLQATGRRVYRSAELGRLHRLRLLEAGFVRSPMDGWLYATTPGDSPEDPTAWYAAFWEFVAAYGRQRFGEDWTVSPEQSLRLHAGNTSVPEQVILCSPRGINRPQPLAFSTSLLLLRRLPAPLETAHDVVVRDGLRLLGVEAALLRVPESFYQRHPVEAQACLRQLTDSSGLLHRLLEGGHSAIAGRIAGALRRVGRPEFADAILATMKRCLYDVRERDPFAGRPVLATRTRNPADTAGRLEVLWHTARETLRAGGPPRGRCEVHPDTATETLSAIEAVRAEDTYHSLALEGYRVTRPLVAQVLAGKGGLPSVPKEGTLREVLAIRGYSQAFDLVKDAARRVLAGESAAVLARAGHVAWYRALFEPGVDAGLLPATRLAGYRQGPVALRGSRYSPPRAELVPGAMAMLFDQFEAEPEPRARCVLAHWLFGYLHPYADGNGRSARLLMNLLRLEAGLPWLIVAVESRSDYLEALDRASLQFDVLPLAHFLEREHPVPVTPLFRRTA